jgi:two-component system, OmpR family, response regulator
MRLLLIEDDDALREDLQRSLKTAGFAVDVTNDGQQGEFLGSTDPYDIVVLDLGLPRMSGLDVLRSWRKQGKDMPVVILTARDAWHERVDGLKAGADDYLGKPFHTEELIARIRAVLRRRHGKAHNVIKVGKLTLDPDRQQVTDEQGNIIELTGMEYRLLHYFMLHPGRILSKIRLSEHIYEGEQITDSNTIEVYVKRLRHKLGEEVIDTRRGQGYVFVDQSCDP